ncbi:MAG: prepilin-type N-terminal cleavage/methylation domain-containing protein [Acidobacteriales bacterium]|nr:prepilin-type N-terminal cleavage/methylation domain-containing protein [Terriglobales bacterium]
MKMRRQYGAGQKGFSMVELMIVIVIILVISAMAMPNLSRGITMIRLRGSLGGVAGLLQKTRIEAVRTNRIMVARYKVVDSVAFAYLDLNQNNAIDGGASGQNAETVIQFGQGAQYVPKPASPPQGLDGTKLLGYDQKESDAPFNVGFSQRGIPCKPDSSTSTVASCQPTYVSGVGGYLYYFKAASVFGDRWGAITITPAGRIRVWTYSDSAGWN